MLNHALCIDALFIGHEIPSTLLDFYQKDKQYFLEYILDAIPWGLCLSGFGGQAK
jgi:hypothetical protein